MKIANEDVKAVLIVGGEETNLEAEVERYEAIFDWVYVANKNGIVETMEAIIQDVDAVILLPGWADKPHGPLYVHMAQVLGHPILNSDLTEIKDDPTVLALQARFSHGHPQFVRDCLAEMALYDAKNHDYAAGGSVFGNFERVGQILALYPGLDISRPEVVAMVYMLKQIDSILWGFSSKLEKKVEGIKDRTQDVSVYSKIVGIISDSRQ